jgi:hypothetical protein
MAELERKNTQVAHGVVDAPTQSPKQQNVSAIQEIAARQFGLEHTEVPDAARSQRQREAFMEAELAPLRRDIETKGEVQQDGIGATWWQRAQYGMDRMRERIAEIWQEQSARVAEKWQDFVSRRRERDRNEPEISR